MDSDLHSHVHLLARGTRRPEPSRPSRLYPDYAKESIPAAPRNAGTQARERDHGIEGRRAAGTARYRERNGANGGLRPAKGIRKVLNTPADQKFRKFFARPEFKSNARHIAEIENNSVSKIEPDYAQSSARPRTLIRRSRASRERGLPARGRPKVRRRPRMPRSRECGGPNLSALRNQEDECRRAGVPRGSRTPVAAVKGRCPGPLDDGDELRFVGRGRPHLAPAAVDLVEPGGIEPPTSTMPL